MNPAGANFLAYFMLSAWLPFSLIIFTLTRPARAAAISVLCGAMFLPEVMNIDPPMLPPFDKLTIPALAVLLGTWLKARHKLASVKSFRRTEAAALAFMASFTITVFTNGDPLPGMEIPPPMGVYDIFAGGVRLSLQLWAPFHVARTLYRKRGEVRGLVVMMAGAGVLYSLIGIVELRLGPTLHDRIYGFMQHDFMQQVREGGYRPMAFMSHGLNYARFELGCLLCATALARIRVPILGMPPMVSVVFLFVAISLFNSSGALIWAVVGVPLVLFTSVTTQLRVATVLGALVFLYPAARVADIVPTEKILDLATEYINANRSSSLKDRFVQEDALLVKIVERPIFGWGVGGRNRIYDKDGNDMVVTDGEWVMIVGQFGAVGFLAYFGLFILPIWAAYRSRTRRTNPIDGQLVAVLGVMVAIFAADNIPNSSGSIPQFFFAGALAGAAEGLVASAGRRSRRASAIRTFPSAVSGPVA